MIGSNIYGQYFYLHELEVLNLFLYSVHPKVWSLSVQWFCRLLGILKSQLDSEKREIRLLCQGFQVWSMRSDVTHGLTSH